MIEKIIETKGLKKYFKRGTEEVHALNETDLAIEKGEYVAIVGPSGSGKSTLLNMLGLLDKPTTGTVLVSGKSTQGLDQGALTRLRRESIGFVFQQFLLLPTLTVKENIELPLLFNKHDGRANKSGEIMELLGLTSRSKHLPHQLSGGEMQRGSIGRALINNPNLVLADEPTGNLDSVTAETIYRLFKKLNDEGLTLVVVTHNKELADMAHRIINIRDGAILHN